MWGDRVFIASDFGRGLALCSHGVDWCFVGEVTNRECFGFPAVPWTIAFAVHGFQNTPHGNHRRDHSVLHIKTHRPPPSGSAGCEPPGGRVRSRLSVGFAGPVPSALRCPPQTAMANGGAEITSDLDSRAGPVFCVESRLPPMAVGQLHIIVGR